MTTSSEIDVNTVNFLPKESPLCLYIQNHLGNCSAIAWSEWSNCAVKKCDVGTGVRNRTHTGFADCNPQYDFQQCTGGCEVS